MKQKHDSEIINTQLIDLNQISSDKEPLVKDENFKNELLKIKNAFKTHENLFYDFYVVDDENAPFDWQLENFIKTHGEDALYSIEKYAFEFPNYKSVNYFIENCVTYAFDDNYEPTNYYSWCVEFLKKVLHKHPNKNCRVDSVYNLYHLRQYEELHSAFYSDSLYRDSKHLIGKLLATDLLKLTIKEKEESGALTDLMNAFYREESNPAKYAGRVNKYLPSIVNTFGIQKTASLLVKLVKCEFSGKYLKEQISNDLTNHAKLKKEFLKVIENK